MTDTNKMRYPAELKLLDNQRVISKWRLLLCRVLSGFVVLVAFQNAVKLEVQSTAALLGSIVGVVLGALLIMFILYNLLSRSMTPSEQMRYLTDETDDDEDKNSQQTIECGECASTTDVHDIYCPDCGSKLRG